MSVFRRILAYSAPYWWRILISALASLAVGGIDGALAYLVGPILQKIFVSQDLFILKILPLAIIGMYVLKGTCRFVNEYFIRTAGQLAIQDIRNDVYRKVMGLGMRFFNSNPTGALMSRVTNDVQVMQQGIGTVITGLFRDGFSIVALLGVIFYRNWLLALVSCFVVPITIIPAKQIGKRIKKLSHKSQEKMGDLSSLLQESFSGIKVIKAFGLEEREIDRFRKVNQEYYGFYRRSFKYEILSNPVMEIITSFGIAAVVWLGASMVISGRTQASDLLSFLAAVALLYTPIKRLNSAFNQIQWALGAAVNVFRIIDEPEEITEAADAVELPAPANIVEFRHVSFTYGDEPVLRDVSVAAGKGEVVALVGPSGGGKTTLVSLIPRFYDVTGGAILMDGIDIRRLKIRNLLDQIALVDQETILFNDTIAANIRYGRSNATDEEVVAAARAAYADDFIVKMPEGYHTSIGDRGVRLSGGQRQRICIARAILKNAPVLILDEATSALDTESEHMVQRAVNNLMANRTTFVIAHRLSTILHADKIIVLERGRVVEAGPHQELLERNGLYRKLYDMQFAT